MKALLRVLLIFTFVGAQADAQQGTPPSSTTPSDNAQAKPERDVQQTPGTSEPPSTSTENKIDARESDEPPDRTFKWNSYEGPYFTGRWGAGFLVEYAAYAQDDASKQQFVLHPQEKLRDFRFILGGKILPRINRRITWSAGIMYDSPNHQWLIRQTGIMIAVPELWGHLFIGRSKEGFSMNKVMTGYDGWTMERATISDASIPILADGIKWLGYSPKHKFLWNAGYFNDVFSHNQAFSTYGSQVAARLVFLPILSDENDKVLHVGMNIRFGKPEDNKIRFRSRPEAYPAPYFLDSGSFPSDSTRMLGYEAYYRQNRWFFGSEYWWINVSSSATHDPVFHGGDVVATYLFNDARRVYNTIGGYFRAVSPVHSVFSGGPGAWEAVLRYSYIDLDSKTVQGGKFARITPMVNWHMSDNVRLEMAYGYGHLDRFDLKGNTQFFQTRLQLQF